jgi:hypothetical protein
MAGLCFLWLMKFPNGTRKALCLTFPILMSRTQRDEILKSHLPGLLPIYTTRTCQSLLFGERGIQLRSSQTYTQISNAVRSLSPDRQCHLFLSTGVRFSPEISGQPNTPSKFPFPSWQQKLYAVFWNGKWRDEDNRWKVDDSQKSFLFTLKNPHNIPARRFALKAEEKQSAINCDSGRVPYFGGGRNIAVSDNCNANTRSFTFPRRCSLSCPKYRSECLRGRHIGCLGTEAKVASF